MATPRKFADLLRKGIWEIQRLESKQEKKLLKDIYEELGCVIGRQASTIDYYLRKHVPTSINELEQLGQEIFRRGCLDQAWLESFLQSGGHPRPSSVYDRILTSTTVQATEQQNTPYRRTKWHNVRKVFSSKSYILESQVELQATSDFDLESVRHRITADDMPLIEKVQVEFKPGFREGGAFQHRILKNVPGYFVWIVEFNPPLKKDQKASYSYKYHVADIKPWTYEECEDLFNCGEMNKKFATARYYVNAPIDDLQIRIEFPSCYPISLPSTGGFGVYYDVVDDINEKTRILAEKGFSANYNPSFQQWTLELKVRNAVPSLSYELQWFPPRRDKLQT